MTSYLLAPLVRKCCSVLAPNYITISNFYKRFPIKRRISISTLISWGGGFIYQHIASYPSLFFGSSLTKHPFDSVSAHKMWFLFSYHLGV